MPRLDQRSINRISRAVKGAEQAPASGSIPPRRAAKAAQVRPAMLAVLASSVTARSGTSPVFTLGSGTATGLWVSSTGVTSTTGKTYTVWNTTKQTIASGSLVQLVWVDGLWCIDVADCS